MHLQTDDADAWLTGSTTVVRRWKLEPLLGVTASLAIENAIRDAHDKGLQLYLVGASAKIQRWNGWGCLT
jgi:SulP family sulfate permease